MALYKEDITDYGFLVNYWNIRSIDIDKTQNSCNIIMNGYVDYDARLNNQAHAKDRVIIVSESDFDKVCGPEVLNQLDNNIYKSAYGYVKTTDGFFRDAEDILE